MPLIMWSIEEGPTYLYYGLQDEGENPPPNSDTRESEPERNRIFVRPR